MRNAAFFALFLAVAGVAVSEPALAHPRSRVSVGIGFGYGYPYWGGPWWAYPPPYYYYPAPVVVQQQPTTYIEQNPQANPAPEANAGWWYYCDQSKGYHPYVRECPTGWQRVPPTPSK